MIAHTQRTGTGFDIVWIAVDDPTTVNYFAPSAANEWDARLSPDGRWLAYSSNETGSAAVTVRARGGSLEIGDPTPIPHSEDSNVLWGDGDRFLIRKELDAAIEEPIRVVRNWKALLEK